MAGVDDLVVYMQTVVKYNTFYIHHPGGAKRPRGGVYTNCCILQQFAYSAGSKLVPLRVGAGAKSKSSGKGSLFLSSRPASHGDEEEEAEPPSS